MVQIMLARLWTASITPAASHAFPAVSYESVMQHLSHITKASISIPLHLGQHLSHAGLKQPSYLVFACRANAPQQGLLQRQWLGLL